ncbi:MAG: hypothetical protein RBR08_14520 [Desulforegulaceae bacterium]|nr:hypothetical protein [Desulforegulaceae bacterium]
MRLNTHISEKIAALQKEIEKIKAEIIQKSEPIPEDFFIDSQILSDPIVVTVILFFILLLLLNSLIKPMRKNIKTKLQEKPKDSNDTDKSNYFFEDCTSMEGIYIESIDKEIANISYALNLMKAETKREIDVSMKDSRLSTESFYRLKNIDFIKDYLLLEYRELLLNIFEKNQDQNNFLTENSLETQIQTSVSNFFMLLKQEIEKKIKIGQEQEPDKKLYFLRRTIARLELFNFKNNSFKNEPKKKKSKKIIPAPRKQQPEPSHDKSQDLYRMSP